MIINVSPLEFGNSLLVPSANSQLPQPIIPISQDVYEVCGYPTRVFLCVLRESSHIPYLA
ncbi:hypothetical protein QZH41_011768, partial [Actinostola sp. cb2023]